MIIEAIFEEIFNFISNFFLGFGITLGFLFVVYIIKELILWISTLSVDTLPVAWTILFMIFIGHLADIFIKRYLLKGKKNNENL